MKKLLSFCLCAALALAPFALGEAFDPDGVYILAVMASNKTALMDEDGDSSDWIEIINGSREAVDLDGWAVSDGKGYGEAWPLPPVTLGPGQSLVVFASDKDRPDPDHPHADFKLSADGEAVLLYDAAGAVASSLSYTDARPDVAVARLSDGSVEAVDMTPTPDEGPLDNPLGVYINEVCASGDGADWAELINRGESPADLSGMGLSDDPARPLRWRFPGGTALAPGALVLVTLAGKDGQAPGDGGLWADFALSEGEALTLSDPEGTAIDRVPVGSGLRGLTLGREPGSDDLRYFDAPTPGAPNDAPGYGEKLAPVTFSQRGGAHREAQVTVELTAPAGAQIHYTTDGTAPDMTSEVYTKPLVIRENTVIRAFCTGAGALRSDESGLTLLPGEETALGVVCVYGDAGALTSGSKGSGKEVYAECYDPDGTQLFAQNCLMKLSGHSSRLELDQKAFSLRAKDEYGQGWFNAALFSNRKYDRYKSIVMRSSGQDCTQTHMLDSILTSLAAATGVYYQETEVCAVFVNGEYRGVYNMRERVSEQSLAQFHGWNNWDDINLVENSGGDANATNGSTQDYHALVKWVKQQDFSSDAAVAELRERVDVENFLDYVALEMYANNQDLDNVRCYNNPGTDDRWRWVLYDLDLAFQTSENAAKGWLKKGRVGSITSQDNFLFPRLMENAKIRDYFLTRLGALLNTAFSAESVASKIDARIALMENEMPRNCQRWSWSFDAWQTACQALRKTITDRPAKLARDCAKAFGLTDREAAHYFGKLVG